MSEAFLCLTGLRKTFGSTLAVEIDQLEARRGELLTLLGPSGCGKTTTLRCIAGLIRADQGRIAIGGRDVSRLPPYRRNLGMVFQNYAIFPHMTVLENVAYGLENRGLSKSKTRARAGEALRLVALEGLEKRYRHQLSGGQQQRVALARAIVYEPDVLLLDEPFSNLDAKLRKTMRLEVRQLQQRLGLTTVFVTHDQQEALSLSDVVAVMDHGKVEQVGPPRDIYENPRSDFVADFIGATNRLAGTVRAYEGSEAEVDVQGAILRVGHPHLLAAGAVVKVLAKPEKVGITLDPTDAEHLRGQVIGLAYLGSVVQYQVRVGDDVLEVLEPSNRECGVGPGTNVGLTFERDSLRLLES